MKIKLLFVDDEFDVLDGYKRMFFSLKKSWELHFAESGKEALEIMKNVPVDVIVTDIRMPEIDGAELLSIVRENYPQTLRIILSGHQDEIRALRATVTAHQFLSKPCNSELLRETIEQAFLLRSYINNEKMLEIITGMGDLPSLPEIYREVEIEMSKNEVSLEVISNIISRDPPLIAKILQIVNSGFFGLPTRITNLLQALSYLGVNTIKALILHTHIFSTNKLTGAEKKEAEIISSHSLKVALLSKKIAKTVIQDKVTLDDTFITGILHDIGKLILLCIPNYLEIISNSMETDKISFNEAEFKNYSFSHAEAGAYLLGIWGLPDNIVKGVAFHHFPSKIEQGRFSSLTAVYLANEFLNTGQETISQAIEIFKTNGEVKKINTNEKQDFEREIKNIIPNFDFEHLNLVEYKSFFSEWLGYSVEL